MCIGKWVSVPGSALAQMLLFFGTFQGARQKIAGRAAAVFQAVLPVVNGGID
jgi:hypothetical protein